MGDLSSIQIVAISVVPFVFAITVHEAAHGFVAKRLGDSTAEMMGRLTLNPIRHIDPVGTLLLPIALLLMHLPVIGWAKPVPINWEKLKRPKRDIGLVAVAGPGVNLLMGLFWALVMKLGTLLIPASNYFGVPLTYMGFAGIFINGILMILNMLPLPPLDGGRVLVSLLPARFGEPLKQLERYGMLILIFLLISGLLGAILLPPFFAYLALMGWMFDIHPFIAALMQSFSR